MSTVEFDRKEPDVNAMVENWVDDGEYDVRMRIRQSSSNSGKTRCEIMQVADETGGEEEGTEEAPVEGEKPKGKMAGKPAIVITFGKH